MHLGQIFRHLHTKEADASLNVNMPWLQANGNADGTLNHRQDYQQLQTTDERPNHSWNLLAVGVWQRFWWHGKGWKKDRAKRDKLHFCNDSWRNLPHPQRAKNHICVHRCWCLSPEIGPPLHSNYCWGQLSQVSRQTLEKNNQPHHFQAYVEQCPQHKRCKVYVPGFQELLFERTAW